MPITSPSYFPPSRANASIIGITAGQNATGARVFLAGQSAGNFSTQADLIVIGDHSLSAGVTDVNGAGTTVIGSGSLKAVLSFTRNNGSGNPLNGSTVAVGQNIAPLLDQAPSSVYIGNNILANASFANNPAATGGNVLIGYGIYQKTPTIFSGFYENVFIGYNCMQSNQVNLDAEQNVFIGARAGEFANTGIVGTIAENVVIGYQAGQSLAGQGNTMVGHQAGSTMTGGGDNVNVGHVTSTGGAGINNTLVGASITHGAGNRNVVIGGHAASAAGSQLGDGNVWIGAWAGFDADFSIGNKFLLEINDAAAGTNRHALMWGDFSSGSVVIGNSVPGVNRDFPINAINLLKLLISNATAPATAAGGGYFYIHSVSHALRWKGPAGTDTVIAPP